jgi:short-subunit dehydrogenase
MCELDSKALIEDMPRRHSGTIINISSVSDRILIQ